MSLVAGRRLAARAAGSVLRNASGGRGHAWEVGRSRSLRCMSTTPCLLALRRTAARLSAAAAEAPAPKDDGSEETAKRKKRHGLLSQARDAVLHVYHGFRLLLVNTKVALKLQKRVLSGAQLTRRERQLLERTVKDLIRMVPFSLFIIIPGAELLLPVALMMFPDLMPSTFKTREQTRKSQILDNLKRGAWTRRIFEHTFSRIIIDEGYDLYSPSWGILKRVGKGDVVSENDIKTLAVHFGEGRRLDLRNLPSWIVRDVAKLLNVYGRFAGRILPRTLYDARLRNAIEDWFERIEADDRNLEKFGLENLNEQELEAECAKRHMRWFGSPPALRLQLTQWCNITNNRQIASHILAFVRPCATSHKDMLKNLSKQEISQIDDPKYADTQLTKQVKKLTGGVKEQPSITMDSSIMQEDVADLKGRVRAVEDEVEAAENALKHVREGFADFSEDEIREAFKQIADDIGSPRPDGEIGVNVIVSARELVRHFKEKKPELKLTAFRLIMCLREFDIDASDCITFEEFNSFIARIKSST
ncbi:LETM1 and EF-hand domain-containing protein anon-60Da [Diplonema papillatum]|nr:LETM1 and EF-hand domain-containing protein anon-60Da [Diplonema papillatum]